mgnify:CR=1 FL=1
MFSLKTLELPIILEKINKYTKTNTTKDIISNLVPLTNKLEINKQLNETNNALNIINSLGSIPFYDDYDIYELFEKLNREQPIHIKDILYILLFLKMEFEINQYFTNLKALNINYEYIEHYFKNLTHHKFLYNFIIEKIDLDGYILDNATPELYDIRTKIRKFNADIKTRLDKLMNQYSNYLNENVLVMRNDRFCLPIKEAFKNNVKGVIHDISQSGQTIYIEPIQTYEITQKIETHKILEQKEIEKILYNIQAKLYEYKETLENNLNQYISLELIFAKANYAKEINANLPNINDEGNLYIKNARHPLINPNEVVPISLSLNKHHNFMLITGPNTGGKTVALKTVGLFNLMLQCGLLVPCEKTSTFEIYNEILADIGDEQSILQSLSTFSSHMTKIISMLNNVSDNSLILLDELGSGTDPNEGVSLAMAIIDYLANYKLKLLVTSHYSELKSYAYEKTNIKLASVAFDKTSLKPLYYIKEDTTGSSHAFLIAKRLGLKTDILDIANKYYAERKTDVHKILDRISEEKLILDERLENLIKKEDEADAKFNHYKQELELLNKEKTIIIADVKKQEEKKWFELKQELEELLHNLKNKETLSNPEFASIKQLLNKEIEKTERDQKENIEIGDDVYIISYDQYGIVENIKNKIATVKFGNFVLDFKISDLKLSAPIPKKAETIKESYVKFERQTTTTLDLRGYRYEEVHEALEQFIDRSLLSNILEIKVIHGFGTGAIRKAVYEYIKKSSHIESSRFGKEGEGLNGVTIITLK